jgi:putative Mg2+ transporter-C (MgtC) family protein
MESSLAPMEIALRLLAAAAAGLVLGVNRDLKGKPTGLRTLSLVALGAALATVATVYLVDIQSDPNALSRVVQGVLQGVLTGIAFLGAGAIIRSASPDETPGLTTAANVFVTAAIGIACGLGAWWAALIGTIIALVVLAVLNPIEHRLERIAATRKPGEGRAPQSQNRSEAGSSAEHPAGGANGAR